MPVLDEARFTKLSERHRRELQVHSYRMLGNLEQAEDAVQEALLRAWKGRASFDGGPGARAWLYRIVTTTCFDILRTAQRRGEQVESIADVPWLQPYPDALLDTAGEPEGAAIRRETVELASLAVIRDDIRVSMPPNPGLFTGKEAIAGLMALAFDRSVFGEWKLLPTAANRMPAAASYLRRADSDVYLPSKLDVLRIGNGMIAEITTFDASLFDRFGLPPSLPATTR